MNEASKEKRFISTKNVELPDFMKEDWLEETLKELDKSNLTPEQRAELEMIIAGNMTEKVAMEEEWKVREEKVVTKAVTKAVQLGILTDAQIADINDVSIDFVKQIRTGLSEKD